jgi:sterol desaturase/sphingolipid hydroxylase (fatty acid hydroxylase superfamily)
MAYRDTVEPSSERSWLAHMSAGLGALALMGVLCFHFPELLTSRDFRQAYSESFARHLLLVGVIAAFVMGTVSILRNRNRRVALFGVISAACAVLLGGATVQFDPIKVSAYSLGLDWFVISLFFSTIVFVPLERMFHVRNLSPLRPGWRTDLTYYFFSHILVQFILIVVTTSSTTMDSLIASVSVKAWIQSLPLWLQFLAAVFFADLFQAGLHRIYHHVPFLWRFHAVHHSSRHMDWLAGSRVHLIEVLMTRSAVLLPLVVLGFAQEAVNAYIILVGIQAVLVHANIDFDFGWLEYVLVTPRYHHWHHARHIDYMYVNYAIHLPLVDMLMGTFKRPPRGQWPEEYGVMKLETVPNGVLAQTVMPFGSAKVFADFVGKDAD